MVKGWWVAGAGSGKMKNPRGKYSHRTTIILCLRGGGGGGIVCLCGDLRGCTKCKCMLYVVKKGKRAGLVRDHAEMKWRQGASLAKKKDIYKETHDQGMLATFLSSLWWWYNFCVCCVHRGKKIK